MPELQYDDLSQVPEGLQEHAKPVVDENGKETNKVSINVVPKTKLDEFRENNLSLSKERDKLNENLENYQKLVGEDPEAFRKRVEELEKTKKRVDDGELVANSSLDEALETRTKEMKSEYEGKIDALAKERDSWKSKWQDTDTKHRRSIVDRAVTDAILDKDVGARPEARQDILHRAYNTFKVDENGNLRAFDEEGNVIYGADGANPMTPKEWLFKMKEQAPYFFQDSSGGGANSGGGGAMPNGKLSPDQIAKLSPDDYSKARREGKI